MGLEIKTSKEQLQNESDKLIIFIDDEHYVFSHRLIRPFSKALGVKARFMGPLSAQSISNKDLKNTSVIFVDQFAFESEFRELATKVLTRAKRGNNKLAVVETSNAPMKQPQFTGSIGVVSTIEMVNTMRDFLSDEKVTDNPDYLLHLIRFHFNSCFRRANNAEFLPEGNYLDSNMNLLLSHENLGTLCELLGIKKEEYKKQLKLQPTQNLRKFLHSSWSVLGHLSIKSEEEFYSFSLVRLKGLITPQQ